MIYLGIEAKYSSLFFMDHFLHELFYLECLMKIYPALLCPSGDTGGAGAEVTPISIKRNMTHGEEVK